MKQHAALIAVAPIAVALVALAGCATSAPPGAVEALSCQEIDAAVGATAKDISRTAIRRGNVAEYRVPFWVLGADRAKRALVSRDTRIITELQARQEQLSYRQTQGCRS